MNKGILAGGIMAILATVGVAVGVSQAKTPPPPTSTPTLTTLELSANSTSISVNGSVTFTVTTLDQNGNPMSGLNLTLFEQTTMQTFSFPATDSAGTASYTIAFASTGADVFYAEN
jgi:hypothetical protein